MSTFFGRPKLCQHLWITKIGIQIKLTWIMHIGILKTKLLV